MEIGDIIRIKEEYAFEISINKHYGEVIDTNINTFNKKEISLKSDLRYTHDSIIWIEEKYYEKLNNVAIQ